MNTMMPDGPLTTTEIWTFLVSGTRSWPTIASTLYWICGLYPTLHQTQGAGLTYSPMLNISTGRGARCLSHQSSNMPHSNAQAQSLATKGPKEPWLGL